MTRKFPILNFFLRWTCLIVPVGITVGSMVALFLAVLHWAINYRFEHPWLLFLLPVGGVVIHFIYRTVGKSSEKGNNLVIDEIHQPGGGIPPAMAPIILLTTVMTHLFGGSAGREGTAVQIGGSIANLLGRWFKLSEEDMRLMLIGGVAAGFGAVFGTPLTGAIFALEVLCIGKVNYQGFVPAMVASLVGNLTVSFWGIHHTLYRIIPEIEVLDPFSSRFHFNVLLLAKIIVASILFGLASRLFSYLVHAIKEGFNRVVKQSWLIPLLGGLIIIILTFLNGKQDYLSLGVDSQYAGAVTLPSAFMHGGADSFSWLWKTVYTTITLGTGFKGGEVTPLFYIGATLGNTLSVWMDAPVSLFAALGFIAVFAGATNTPLACTLMGVELFGGEYVLFFGVACFTAYFCSGNSGIYSSQLLTLPKLFISSVEKKESEEVSD